AIASETNSHNRNSWWKQTCVTLFKQFVLYRRALHRRQQRALQPNNNTQASRDSSVRAPQLFFWFFKDRQTCSQHARVSFKRRQTSTKPSHDFSKQQAARSK